MDVNDPESIFNLTQILVFWLDGKLPPRHDTSVGPEQASNVLLFVFVVVVVVFVVFVVVVWTLLLLLLFGRCNM